MGGTYGYELDIRKLPEEELQEIEKLNQRVHAWQDVLLYGSFYRLQSPYQGNESAWMSVSQDGKRAVVTHVFAQSQPNARSDLLKLTGLDPAADYREEISGKTYGGDALMQYGIPVDAPWNDYKAQQFWLERVDR